jgi:Domain of unknown function (DUF5664)
MSNNGIKHDDGKPRLDLLSTKALNGVADVLRFGAQKYAADNWRGGMAWRRLIRAALNHLTAFADGVDTDAESGLPHLDHALCCLMFLSEYQKTDNGTDDRYRARPSGEDAGARHVATTYGIGHPDVDGPTDMSTIGMDEARAIVVEVANVSPRAAEMMLSFYDGEMTAVAVTEFASNSGWGDDE